MDFDYDQYVQGYQKRVNDQIALLKEKLSVLHQNQNTDDFYELSEKLKNDIKNLKKELA